MLGYRRGHSRILFLLQLTDQNKFAEIFALYFRVWLTDHLHPITCRVCPSKGPLWNQNHKDDREEGWQPSLFSKCPRPLVQPLKVENH